MDPKIFHKLSYGLYVVSSKLGDRLNAQIANTVFQISSDPPTVAVSLNKNNLTNQFVNESKVFAVSVLPLTVPLELIGHFGFKSGRDFDKFAEIAYTQGMTGAPLIKEHSIGFLEAEVIAQMDVETHTVFIGKVINAEVFSEEEVLTYAQYHQLKRGKTPASLASAAAQGQAAAAPQAAKAEGEAMSKYVCQVCGYVYDPQAGADGVSPGTAFADLPEKWVCPVCGVGKENFEPMK